MDESLDQRLTLSDWKRRLYRPTDPLAAEEVMVMCLLDITEALLVACLALERIERRMDAQQVAP